MPALKPLCGELNRGPVAARAVDVAVQRLVQLAEVTMCQATSIADGHLTKERHVVHAPQHAAVRGLGQDQLLRAQVAERCRRQALPAQFPLDQPAATPRAAPRSTPHPPPPNTATPPPS